MLMQLFQVPFVKNFSFQCLKSEQFGKHIVDPAKIEIYFNIELFEREIGV